MFHNEEEDVLEKPDFYGTPKEGGLGPQKNTSLIRIGSESVVMGLGDDADEVEKEDEDEEECVAIGEVGLESIEGEELSPFILGGSKIKKGAMLSVNYGKHNTVKDAPTKS